MESNYFKKFLRLKEECVTQKVKIIYLKKCAYQFAPLEKSKNISFSYIGNIGSIYDFRSLLYILAEIKKQDHVFLNIIGDGDRKDWLISTLIKAEIPFEYFGQIFDEKRKHEILGSSWFGFNGFRQNTEVSLSYKSIDYLSSGLPLINSARGDTWYFVDKHHIGFNYKDSNLDSLIKKILNVDEKSLKTMSINCINLFEKYFTIKSLNNEIMEIFRGGSN